MIRIYTDIETGPYNRLLLDKNKPTFEAPSNYKDPDKIAAAIAEKQEKWYESACLSPMTSYAVTAGFKQLHNKADLYECEGPEGDENADKNVIQAFVDVCQLGYEGKAQIIGWNIFEFDLPFILKRAWKHRIDTTCIPVYRNRYWPEYFIDLMHVWSAGKSSAGGKLDEVSKYLGFAGKNGDGALFYKQYYSPEREIAKSYAINDLVITEEVGEVILPKH